jgi:hypothetical protein
MGTLDLGNPITLTLRTDMNTPAQHLQYEGLKLTVPEGVAIPPLGEFSTLKAFGVTVHGFVRTSPTGLEWLIGPIPDPSLALVDAIPGPGGWGNQGARQGYLAQANYLLGAGISGAVLWPGLANFYNWAAADLAAKGWAAP